MADVYCIDTSIVIFMHQRLPRDIYPGLWEQMEDLIARGRAHMAKEAHLELKRVDDGCFDWADGRDGFVEEPVAAMIFDIVQLIADRHDGWVSEQRNQADPWVVAHACSGGYVVVTDERRKGPGGPDRNLKIPNVADEFRVECITLNELARREGWVFGR